MSKDMYRVVDQQELALLRTPEMPEIPIELIRAQKTGGAAFSLACQTSGLEDKEIYLALGLDAGYFSRMKKGDATLSDEKMRDFCRTVGNTIYPEWRAYQIGCTLTMIQSEAERLAAEAQAELEKEREKNKLLMQLFQRTAV